jgi:hypothetical protein
MRNAFYALPPIPQRYSAQTRQWRNSGPETLVLITSGGKLNKSTRRSEQNIVVYAVPIHDAIDTAHSI